MSLGLQGLQQSSSLAVPRKGSLVPPKVQASVPLGHIRETLPMPFVLQPPEEQTDNWDDDFEEGISLTKLHGMISVMSLL